MLRKLIAAACFALLGCLSPSAYADNVPAFASCGSETLVAGSSYTLSQDATGKLCVNATVNASVGGFVPSLSYTTLTATAASSASTALPTNSGTVAFQNQNAVAVSCTLASGAATALTNEIIVPAGSTIFIGTTGYSNAACINQTGSASNVIVLAGGTGLGTGFGGGGSGGGGGAITAAASSYAAGAFSAGLGVDGWDLTQGAKTDAACAGDNTSGCSVEARLQRIAQNLTTLNTSVNASVPAGTNLIGKVGIDQTTPGTTNGTQDASTGATGSAPPSKAIEVGAIASGATGGLLQGIAQCDQTAIYDASTNGSTLLKAGVSGRKFKICGWWFGTGGTATNVKLVEGTTTTTPCDTGTANVTPAFQLAANTQSGFNGPFWNGLGTATAADNLCINASAGNAVQAIVWFTQY